MIKDGNKLVVGSAMSQLSSVQTGFEEMELKIYHLL